MNLTHPLFRPCGAASLLLLAVALIGRTQGVGQAIQARNQAVQAALRDPTQPGAALQQLIQSGPATGGRLLRLQVRGTGTNATPEEIESFRKAKPKERVIEMIEATAVPFLDVARALAKTTVLPAGALLLLLLWRYAGTRRQTFAFIVGAALLLGPWIVHNWLTLGRFEMANGNAGISLFAGTVANVLLPSWDTFPEYIEARGRWEKEGREAEPVFDHYLARLAMQRIAAEPLRWADLALERAFRFMLPARQWFVVTGRSQTASAGPVYLAAIAIQMLLFGACALLLIDGVRRSRDPSALVAPLIVFSHQFVYAASHASPRYGATVGPILFASLPWSLSHRPVAQYTRSRRRPPNRASADSIQHGVGTGQGERA